MWGGVGKEMKQGEDNQGKYVEFTRRFGGLVFFLILLGGVELETQKITSKPNLEK